MNGKVAKRGVAEGWSLFVPEAFLSSRRRCDRRNSLEFEANSEE
jgi:hypothetical protein